MGVARKCTRAGKCRSPSPRSLPRLAFFEFVRSAPVASSAKQQRGTRGRRPFARHRNFKRRVRAHVGRDRPCDSPEHVGSGTDTADHPAGVARKDGSSWTLDPHPDEIRLKQASGGAQNCIVSRRRTDLRGRTLKWLHRTVLTVSLYRTLRGLHGPLWGQTCDPFPKAPSRWPPRSSPAARVRVRTFRLHSISRGSL